MDSMKTNEANNVEERFQAKLQELLDLAKKKNNVI